MGSSPRAARTELLREILDLAIVVGRRVEAEGRGPVPAPLRPVLGMTRVGNRARAAADRAGDDDAFRAQVAEAVEPAELDPAGRLWLTRPDGWEAELDALVRQQADADADADARRALDRERRARRRAEHDRDGLRTEVEALRAEVDDLRARSEAAEARADEASSAAATASEERAVAVRQLKDLETAHQRTHEDLRAAKAALAEPPAAPAAAPAPAPAAVPVPSEPVAAPLDAEALAAVDTAAGAAAELARALDALAARLRPADDEPPPPPARAPRPRRERRRPALPGGVHDDSPEAAAHLVRLPGCALLVDGYNATMSTWPGRDLPEQRRRLVDALDQLEARVGVHVTVVFDGVEDAWRRSASRRVDVRFTPVGVEADDVILDLVDALPPDRPVVVATDDQRVRTGALRRGAAPIGIDQLRSLL